MPKKDKRNDVARNPTEAVVACRPFTSSGATLTTDGVVLNFSEGGFYFETSREFKPGAILHMRIVHYSPIPPSLGAEDQPRSNCLAEVKWRQELADQKTAMYGLGVRYLD